MRTTPGSLIPHSANPASMAAGVVAAACSAAALPASKMSTCCPWRANSTASNRPIRPAPRMAKDEGRSDMDRSRGVCVCLCACRQYSIPSAGGGRFGAWAIILAMTSSTPLPGAPGASDAIRRYARVLSIAGSDSGGGAGIQADLKTFGALGCYGMTAITAITAQNTCAVTGIHGIPPEMLKAQIDAVVQDIGVDAVKIGMLHSPAVVRVVADAIRSHRLPQVVLDPVMVTSSGDRLMAQETGGVLGQEGVGVLVQELFPLAVLITPNLDEAGWLLGRSIDGVPALEQAAQDLLRLGARAVLLKGGHLPGAQVVDVLAVQGAPLLCMQSPRIATHNGHGTGCTLSSAIAAHLALGRPLPQAGEQARPHILPAMAAGARENPPPRARPAPRCSRTPGGGPAAAGGGERGPPLHSAGHGGGRAGDHRAWPWAAEPWLRPPGAAELCRHRWCGQRLGGTGSAVEGRPCGHRSRWASTAIPIDGPYGHPNPTGPTTRWPRWPAPRPAAGADGRWWWCIAAPPCRP